ARSLHDALPIWRLAARDAQPVADVRRRFGAAQRLEVIAARDALRDLTHLRALEQVAELRLTDQDDLQQLLRRRLEIRQEPHLLEELGAQRLRFVDDQHDSPTLRVRVEQVPIQRRDQRTERPVRRNRHAELLADVLDELAGRELRIQDQRNLGFFGQLLEDAPDQCRLARADLAGEL